MLNFEINFLPYILFVGTKMVEQHILQLQEETEKEPEKAASKKPTAGSANKKSNKKPKAKKPRR
jgi:hypothetical protein